MIIKNRDELLSHGNVEGRRAVLDILEAGLSAADPYWNVRNLIRVEDGKLIVGNDQIKPGRLAGLPTTPQTPPPHEGPLVFDLSQVGKIYVVGGGKAAQVRRLGRYAYYSGLAFQVIDDYLGITADEKVLGKPVGSDIREGKRTLILIHALTNATKTKRNQMYSVLGRGDATPTEIEEVSRIIHSLGSLDYAFKKAEQLVAKAKRQLSPFPSSQTKETLLNLADYVVSRKY